MRKHNTNSKHSALRRRQQLYARSSRQYKRRRIAYRKRFFKCNSLRMFRLNGPNEPRFFF